MINQGVLTVEGIDDIVEMKITDEAFDVLGFTPEEKLSLYKGCYYISLYIFIDIHVREHMRVHVVVQCVCFYIVLDIHVNPCSCMYM